MVDGGRRTSSAVEAKNNTGAARVSNLGTITFTSVYTVVGRHDDAATETERIQKIYILDVVVIPTHLLFQRQDADLIYKTKRAKYAAVVNQVTTLHQRSTRLNRFHFHPETIRLSPVFF